MNVQEFCARRPYLYHLTDRANLGNILFSGTLLSTQAIAEMSMTGDKLTEFLSEKRDNHTVFKINEGEYRIRDQRPISIVVLKRSLSGDMTTGEFIKLLNKRVFWWPSLERLKRHYDRYESESPVVLRVQSSALFAVNYSPEFCHLNSGATRCHPSYGGNAPTRGLETFVAADNYDRNIASVAEVTFLDRCNLPDQVWTSDNPSGPWKLA